MKNSLFINIFVIALSIVLIWSSVFSLKTFVANSNYYSAKHTISLLRENTTNVTPETFEQTLIRAKAAAAYESLNPLYTDLLGELYEWESILYPSSQSTSLSEAKAYYLKSIELRPTWPVSWTSLALVKWRQNQFDDELFRYLSFASYFGPKKREVTMLYVNLGVALYKANNPYFLKIKDEFIVRLEYSLEDFASQNEVRRLLREQRMNRQACAWLRNSSDEIRELIWGCN